MRRLRFGLLAVFATMLIVIGVAGWLRAELDLYREERALVAEFAKAGCETHVLRGELATATVFRRQQEGYAWYEPEWLMRMTSLSVTGDPPEALLRRAAALPTLQSLRVSPMVDWTKPISIAEAGVRPEDFPPSLEIVGRTLPDFREPSIDGSVFDMPLPDGETIEGAEREAILSSVRERWKPREPERSDYSYVVADLVADDPDLPARFVKRIEAVGPRNQGAMKVDLVRDGKSYWSVQQTGFPHQVENQLLTLRNAEGEYGLAFRDQAWRFYQRADAEIDPLYRQGTALRSSWNHLPRPYLLPNFPHSAILDHVARVVRIDESRVRLDVEPFEVDVTRDPAYPESVAVEWMTLVLREDMDWAVGSERSKVITVSGKTRTPQFDYVVERAFERRDGYVLPIEELRGTPVFDQTSPGVFEPAKGPAGLPKYEPFRARFAWELNPDLDGAIFDPNHYLAEPLAPRTRPFPWYLVPLAFGAVGLVLLIGRGLYRLVRHRGRSKRPEPAEAPG